MGSIRDLAKYRFEKANEQLKVARDLLEGGSYNFSLNRSYYAIFHAIRAVNALDDFDSSKHSGVIAHFNQNHVKTGEFDKESSKIIRNASELRERSDYEDFFTASQTDAESVLKKAEAFVATVESFLENKGVI